MSWFNNHNEDDLALVASGIANMVLALKRKGPLLDIVTVNQAFALKELMQSDPSYPSVMDDDNEAMRN